METLFTLFHMDAKVSPTVMELLVNSKQSKSDIVVGNCVFASYPTKFSVAVPFSVAALDVLAGSTADMVVTFASLFKVMVTPPLPTLVLLLTP